MHTSSIVTNINKQSIQATLDAREAFLCQSNLLELVSWLKPRGKYTMEVLKGDFYCYECSVQFDKKHVFDIHLSDVHEEQLDKKTRK